MPRSAENSVRGWMRGDDGGNYIGENLQLYHIPLALSLH